MKLISLQVEGFGPYVTKQDIDFEPAHRAGLFLVQGATGSGKSSLLDALCFALYGQTTSDKRDAADLRSHHFDSPKNSSVQLTFELGSSFYRIERQLVLKKNGNIEQTVLLERKETDNWKALASKLSHCAELVIEITGLSADQFKQVIVLPQGKFREFLASKPNEKVEILRSLFKTSVIELFVKILAERQRLGYEKLQTSSTRFSTLRERASGKSHAELGSEIQEERALLANYEAQLPHTQLKLQEANRMLANAQRLLELSALVHQLSERHKLLDSQETEMQSLQIKLEKAHKVLQIASLGTERKTSETLLKKQEDQLNAYLENENSTREHFLSLQQKLEKMEQVKVSMQELEEHLSLMRALLPLFDHKKKTGLELERLEDLIKQNKVQLISLENQNKSNSLVDQAGLAHDAQNIERVQRIKEAMQVLLGDYRNVAKQDAQLENSQRSLEAERSLSVQHIVHESDELSGNLAFRDSCLVQLEQLQAANMASQLQNSEACPVCGSIDHPQPARSDADYHQVKERFDKVQVSIDQVNASLAHHRALSQELGHQLQENGDQKNTCQVSLKSLSLQAQTLISEVPSLTESIEVHAMPDEILEQLQGFLEQKKRAYLALSEQNAKQTEQLQALRIETATVESTVRQAQIDLDRHQNNKQNCQAEIDKIYSATSREVIVQLSLPNFDFNGAIIKTETALKSTKQSLDQWQIDHQTAKHAWNMAQEASLREQKQVAASRAVQLELDQRWKEAYTAKGFASEEECKGAWLDEIKLDTQNRSLQDWKRSLLTTQTDLANAKQQMASLENIQLDQAKLNLEQAQEASDGLLMQQARLAEHLGHQTSLLKDLELAQEEFQNYEKQHQSVNALLRALKGSDHPSRVSIERYALSVFLDEVLEEANSHLSEMSRGRYQLNRHDETVDKRSAGGLEIVIFDAYTGQLRSSASLSGGEGFISSLALALGLSATVHRQSGGVRLDTLLIDEGFGSLDEESLQDAMNVLASLHEKGRTVGIISHVRELQERIPCQLFVHKTQRGSTVSWA